MLLKKQHYQIQSLEFDKIYFQELNHKEMQSIFGGKAESFFYSLGQAAGHAYCAIKADIMKERPAVENPTALELCTA